MRLAALDFLACPRCHGALQLTAGAPAGAHVLEGQLRCGGCDAAYPIVRGVPRLVLDATATDASTPARFAEEWRRYSELAPHYEQQFLDWLAPVGRKDFAGRLVFEGGCGKGRHTALAASFGARAVVAVDLGEAAEVAFANTRDLETVHIVIGDLRQPPVRPVFELSFSIGVLHHLTEPRAGFQGLL
ncbi:MAG TPA: Trm112 family protein, partial [Polyangia bacterium]